MMMLCANKKCRRSFERKASNQIYCSSECCKIVTSENLKERYRLNKERKSGVKRICDYCPTVLSKANLETICASCNKQYTPDKRNRLKAVLWP